MPGKAFVDANVIIYSFATDEPVKQRIARQLLTSEPVTLSCQVLQECANVLRRRMGDTPERAAERLRPFLRFEVVPITLDLVQDGWALASRYGFSTYDASIVAAAQLARCSVLYTEDLQAGMVLDGLKIVNPFRDRPAA